MGIFCKISLHKPLNHVYRPGDLINGEIVYAVEKETVLKSVTVSLIGKAKCQWTESRGKNRKTYTGTEKIYTIHTSILENDEIGVTVAVNSYNVPFNFILPHNIPSTFKDYYGYVTHRVRIKFDLVGLLNFTTSRKFFVNINVLGNVDRIEPYGPVIYGNKRQLTELFSTKNNVVNIKATIHKTFASPGSEIELDCEAENNTKHIISTVKVQLVEKYTYTSDGGRTKIRYNKMKECKTKSEPVEQCTIGKFSPKIKIPREIHSIQHCQVFQREYFVLITGKLPMPHRNLTFEIPIVVGENLHENNKTSTQPEELHDDEHPTDDPPSYWEVMYEDKKMALDLE